MTNEEIVGALARGYCSKENENKVLDPDLIQAMAIEVEKLLTQKDTEIQKAREEERERIGNNLPEYWLDSESVPFDCDHNRCIELVKKALTPSSHGTKRNY